MTDMNLKEKLVELLDNLNVVDDWYTNGEIADHLIAHGVTFAEDNNVPSKWISVNDRLPDMKHFPMFDPIQTNADRMIKMLQKNDAYGLLDWWQVILEDGVPSEDYFKWWLKQPAEE